MLLPKWKLYFGHNHLLAFENDNDFSDTWVEALKQKSLIVVPMDGREYYINPERINYVEKTDA